jgi:hypothetical protein
MTAANANYTIREVPSNWAESRETSAVVAMAIFAIASGNRTPEAIWEEPTGAEWDSVVSIVEQATSNGDFDADGDGEYRWGLETIKIS